MATNIEDLKILLVEDNLQARTMIRMVCKELGINEVYTASDGKEALDFLGACDDLVDLVICDWKMPRPDRHRHRAAAAGAYGGSRHTVSHAHRAAADAESVATARESGVSAYLRKPFAPDQLEARIRMFAEEIG